MYIRVNFTTGEINDSVILPTLTAPGYVAPTGGFGWASTEDPAVIVLLQARDAADKANHICELVGKYNDSSMTLDEARELISILMTQTI